MTERALAISPDENIRFLHLFYSGMTNYYERNLTGALEDFEQARKIAGDTPEYKEGLEKIESITSKITALQHEGA
jgi:hypothetical protein